MLRVLWDDEGLSQVELAERMRVEKASLTGVLDAMEKRGLIVALAQHPGPAQGQYSSDDPRPHAERQAAAVYRPRSTRKATRGMTADEVDTLRRLLTQVIDNLERG